MILVNIRENENTMFVLAKEIVLLCRLFVILWSSQPACHCDELPMSMQPRTIGPVQSRWPHIIWVKKFLESQKETDIHNLIG